MPTFGDRIKETTTTTGTGTVTLAGAASGYVAFNTTNVSPTLDGQRVCYEINDNAGTWEVGEGKYTAGGTTLSRDLVLSSSAGTTALINFAAGTKDVFLTLPAARIWTNGRDRAATRYAV